MNINKFLKIFVPTDLAFFPLFEEAAVNLVKASELLVKMMETSDFEEHERIAAEIKNVEHICDGITNKTYEQLNKSFITPFDREDIHELNGNIDDVVDSINGISRRICLYKPKKLNLTYKELAEMIHEAALLLEGAIKCLKKAGDNRSKIMKDCARVKEIEHNADDAYYKGVSSLFENEADPKELLKNIRILEILERCVDEEEDISDTIKAILIKMA